MTADSGGVMHRAARRVAVRPTLWAGAMAATLSGVPSTAHALLTERDPLAATRAAGTLIRSPGSSTPHLVTAGVLAHLAISAWWTVVLAVVLPRRRPVLEGAAAGLAIAALDLGVVGRHNRAIADLPLVPQIADHVVFGVLVVTLLTAAQRRGRAL